MLINFRRRAQFQECRPPIFRVAGLRFTDLDESSAPPREPTGHERLGHVPFISPHMATLWQAPASKKERYRNFSRSRQLLYSEP
jgi:hypothetical protein